jgi:hypothetical protein
MENIEALPKTILKTKSFVAASFTSVFVALSVALPWFAHQFNLAGQVYLPMHFFVIFAGLLLGWRTGLIVGLFTPIISYAVSGMPILPILPQITVEVALYGLVAGIVREKLHLSLYWSLLIALIAGRIGSLIGILAFNDTVHQPIASVLLSIKMGWPGLLIQLALIPLAAFAVKRYFEKHDNQPPA